jgi:hypothetical protein
MISRIGTAAFDRDHNWKSLHLFARIRELLQILQVSLSLGDAVVFQKRAGCQPGKVHFPQLSAEKLH